MLLPLSPFCHRFPSSCIRCRGQHRLWGRCRPLLRLRSAVRSRLRLGWLLDGNCRSSPCHALRFGWLLIPCSLRRQRLRFRRISRQFISRLHTHTHTHTPVCLRGLCDRVPGRGVDFRPLFDPRPPARTKVYPMLLTSASGPQVGLPGKISGPGAGLSREAAQNWQFPVIPAPPAPGAKLSREAAQN